MRRTNVSSSADGAKQRTTNLRGSMAGSTKFLGAWEPPLPDPFFEAELERIAGLPLGPEVDAEAALAFDKAADVAGQVPAPAQASAAGTEATGNTLGPPAPQCWDATPKSSPLRRFLLELSLVARVLGIVAGVPAGANAAIAATDLIVVAGVSTRFFCAGHLLRIAVVARKLARLDRALRFRAHPQFQPADVVLDDIEVDLEMATDLMELEARDLCALRAEKVPRPGAIMAAQALSEILLAGAPSHRMLTGYKGIWTSDRLIFDPNLLLPLLGRLGRSDTTQIALLRVRSALCAHGMQLTPAGILAEIDGRHAILNNDGAECPILIKDHCTAAPRSQMACTAAAAVVQWAWFQVAFQELACSAGVLEKALLLQPNLAARRLERQRTSILAKLVRLRSDPLHMRLLRAPIDAQLPVPVDKRSRPVHLALSENKRGASAGQRRRAAPATALFRAPSIVRGLSASSLPEHGQGGPGVAQEWAMQARERSDQAYDFVAAVASAATPASAANAAPAVVADASSAGQASLLAPPSLPPPPPPRLAHALREQAWPHYHVSACIVGRGAGHTTSGEDTYFEAWPRVRQQEPLPVASLRRCPSMESVSTLPPALALQPPSSHSSATSLGASGLLGLPRSATDADGTDRRRPRSAADAANTTCRGSVRRALGMPSGVAAKRSRSATGAIALPVRSSTGSGGGGWLLREGSSEISIAGDVGASSMEETEILQRAAPAVPPLDVAPRASGRCRGSAAARCGSATAARRRPSSAPAGLPWSSPGIRWCTPLRA